MKYTSKRGFWSFARLQILYSDYLILHNVPLGSMSVIESTLFAKTLRVQERVQHFYLCEALLLEGGNVLWR